MAASKEIADKIIAAYKAHYSFPPQGESHMHDCIMDALEATIRKMAARISYLEKYAKLSESDRKVLDDFVERIGQNPAPPQEPIGQCPHVFREIKRRGAQWHEWKCRACGQRGETSWD